IRSASPQSHSSARAPPRSTRQQVLERPSLCSSSAKRSLRPELGDGSLPPGMVLPPAEGELAREGTSRRDREFMTERPGLRASAVLSEFGQEDSEFVKH